MINIVSFVIDLIIVLAPGDVAEHTGVDTGSLYGGVFAGINNLGFCDHHYYFNYKVRCPVVFHLIVEMTNI